MNHWQRLRTISFLSFVCLLLIACSSLGQEREEENELVIVSSYVGDRIDNIGGFAFEGEVITSPGPTIRVRKGETVTITFENVHFWDDGTPFHEPHNFTIVADKDVGLPRMEPLWGAHVGGFDDPNLKPGERGSVTFTAEAAGSFFYVCAFSDHIAVGMWGRFVVEE